MLPANKKNPALVISREEIAAMAMQGIISNELGYSFCYENTARMAVKYADALIAELKKEKYSVS